jgi:hypothetical protein
LPDDGFWAAKQVMAFTEPEVRAMVKTADYTSEEGVNYLVKSLMQRREKIGRAYFQKVLPLDNFTVDGGRLRFEDLAVKYGFAAQPPAYHYSWATFDNNTETRTAIAGANSESIPASFTDGYAVVQIHGPDPSKVVDVYLRRRGRSSSPPQVVGIERRW